MKINIDSTSKCGNGDIWMRLIGFYVMQAIYPNADITIRIPAHFLKLAQYTFGDRLTLTNDELPKATHYTSLGIKDLSKDIFFNKKRFVSPYQRAVIRDKKDNIVKTIINSLIFNAFNYFGLIQIPRKKWIEKYQGFLEVAGIRKFHKCNYEQFSQQLAADYPCIYKKLNDDLLPISEELTLPLDIAESIVFFPTGTSRQFVPVWWAKKNMPDAYYAFFHKDSDLQEFKKEGLKTIPFYREPGDILKLAQESKHALSTDSFPSHLLQFGHVRSTIMLTEVLKSRIIAPTFEGSVVDSRAKCHPCLHMARGIYPLCMAGHPECINWIDDVYTRQILESANYN